MPDNDKDKLFAQLIAMDKKELVKHCVRELKNSQKKFNGLLCENQLLQDKLVKTEDELHKQRSANTDLALANEKMSFRSEQILSDAKEQALQIIQEAKEMASKAEQEAKSKVENAEAEADSILGMKLNAARDDIAEVEAKRHEARKQALDTLRGLQSQFDNVASSLDNEIDRINGLKTSVGGEINNIEQDNFQAFAVSDYTTVPANDTEAEKAEEGSEYAYIPEPTEETGSDDTTVAMPLPSSQTMVANDVPAADPAIEKIPEEYDDIIQGLMEDLPDDILDSPDDVELDGVLDAGTAFEQSDNGVFDNVSSNDNQDYVQDEKDLFDDIFDDADFDDDFDDDFTENASDVIQQDTEGEKSFTASFMAVGEKNISEAEANDDVFDESFFDENEQPVSTVKVPSKEEKRAQADQMKGRWL